MLPEGRADLYCAAFLRSCDPKRLGDEAAWRLKRAAAAGNERATPYAQRRDLELPGPAHPVVGGLGVWALVDPVSALVQPSDFSVLGWFALDGGMLYRVDRDLTMAHLKGTLLQAIPTAGA